VVVFALSDRNPRAYGSQPFAATIVGTSFLLAQEEWILTSANSPKYFVKTVKITVENAQSAN
jgi:hypothetical protein